MYLLSYMFDQLFNPLYMHEFGHHTMCIWSKCVVTYLAVIFEWTNHNSGFGNKTKPRIWIILCNNELLKEISNYDKYPVHDMEHPIN